MVSFAAVAGLDRLHKVVPLVFVIVKSNPPMNEPQLKPCSLSRSPMFFPPITMVGDTGIQVSPVG